MQLQCIEWCYMSQSLHKGSDGLLLAATRLSSHFSAVTENNNLFVKAFCTRILPTARLYICQQRLVFIHNSIIDSALIQMSMFTGACLCPHTNAAMCPPPPSSSSDLTFLCPFLFPWHQLWQDETVVVCLPVYTCCADLLLLYSRHRQADRWQPHWHQNRGPLTSVKLQGLCWTTISTDERSPFYLIISQLSNQHAVSSRVTCVNKRVMAPVYCCVLTSLFSYLLSP